MVWWWQVLNCQFSESLEFTFLCTTAKICMILTLCMLNCFKETFDSYLHFFYHSFVWNVEDLGIKDHAEFNQNHVCWCPGSNCRQVISRNDVDSIIHVFDACWWPSDTRHVVNHGSHRPWKVLEFDFCLEKCLIFQSALKIGNFLWKVLENDCS